MFTLSSRIQSLFSFLGEDSETKACCSSKYSTPEGINEGHSYTDTRQLSCLHHITGWTNVNHLYFTDGIAIASLEGLMLLSPDNN